MKKLSFLFAMIFAVSMAMGQNEAETEQDGNQNEVLVKQIGDLNEAESHQYGDENDASVVQMGDDNVGIADQLNGNKNDASVLQDGNTNEAYIAQGMLAGYIDDSHTTSTMTAHRNNASIVQDGNGNYVGEVVQVGNDNNTDIDQLGDNNDAYSYQGWAYRFWGETYATSHLSSYNSEVVISQDGDGNSGRVWQYGGNNNEANISQDGNTNTASVAQGFIYADGAYDFTYPVYNTKDNFVSIDQLGDNNYGKVFQLGDGNSFKLNQTGNGNIVGYDPNGSGGLVDSRNAYFTQDGNNNRFAGVVLNANNNPLFRAGLDAEQFNGATLSYESYQEGDYNDIGLRQGQDDLGLIQQDGIGNEALLWQQGADQNQATMLQFGNNNSAGVVQIQQ